MTEVIFTVLSFGALMTLGLGLAVSEAAVVTALFLAFLQAGGGYLYRLCREPLWNFVQEPGCKVFDTEIHGENEFYFLGGFYMCDCEPHYTEGFPLFTSACTSRGP